MRKLLAFALIVLSAGLNYGQSIDAYPDTTICSAEPVWLYASVEGSYGTETYSTVEIPFAPEPTGGTVHNMVDDTHTGPFDIGFEFCFFGETYDQFYIASNGWISFLTPNANWDVNWTPDGPIPDNAFNVPKAAIFGPWTDWHSGLCTDCIYHEVVGTAPYRRLIVTYEDVPLFLCTGFHGTFQMVLHETTNLIENHLTSVDICPTWDLGIATQGIQNEDGTEAYTVPGRNATDWSATDESWAYVPSAITWFETATGTMIGTGDSIEVSPLTTTTYTAEVTLCDGTTVSDDVTVTVSTPYIVTVDIQNIACNGDNNAWIDIDVTGNVNPITYSWSTGSTSDSIFNLSPGTYSVTISEEGGCSYFQEFTLVEPPVLTIDTVLTIDVTCFGGTDGVVELNPEGGVGPYLFSFDGTTWQTDSNFTTMEAGTFTFTVRDAYGCEAEITAVILSQPPEVIVDAGPNITVPYGSFGILEGSTTVDPVTLIAWSPSTDLSCTDCLNPEASPITNTQYFLSITDENGCVGIDSVWVWVDLDFVVPNAFTPNDDGLNDFFSIHTELVLDFEISITNRWGQVVFTSDDITRGWDGTFNGIPQEIGTYIYNIRSTTSLNTPINKTGTVTLLR